MAPIKVLCQTCPVESVVVYQDRAEVRRSIKQTLAEGQNEVVIEGIVESVYQDSIRSPSHTGISYENA